MDTNKKEYYIGRELSWLAFNERVLSEAQDIHNPLMEKLKFTAIFASNMDEFFMVRVAGLIEQISAGYKKTDIAGYTPEEQLVAVSKETRRLIEKQQSIFRELVSELEKYNVFNTGLKYTLYFNPVLNNEYDEDTENIFIDAVMSVVSPVTLDPAHPFPFIYNKRMSLIAALEKQGREYFSLIMLPENIRRYFAVHKGNKKIIWTVEEIIKKHIQKLFRGYNVKTVNVFRVTRNTDIEMRSEEMADIILSMKDFLSRRVKGAVTRVEIEADTPAYIVEFLQKMVNFKDMDTQYIQGVIDLTFLFSLSSIMPNMQFPVHKSFSVSDLPENSEIFNRIKEKDIFFFRPYYSFSTVSKLIAAAAEDNDVLAIKMTLYRTNRDSSILASLVKAAKSGKQVSVVVELKARFDEERNAGCIVTYGIAGLKIHAKCLLIVRREYESIKRYTHIATGNYNENTAALYTDVDLITSDDSIGRDAAQLFNYLMAYTEEQQWKALSVAPFNLRENLYKLFDNEIKQAKEGRKAHIVMKMNSLIDKDMIDKMYEASNAGVRIDLIVRGICGLKAGCKGFSSNIKVRSIIGRLLEHSRIFYFENAGNPRYFIASADMMPRNLNRRVELMAEINDEDFKNALGKFLDITLKDNMKAWQLTGDTFIKIKKTDDEEAVNSQEYFMNNRLI